MGVCPEGADAGGAAGSGNQASSSGGSSGSPPAAEQQQREASPEAGEGFPNGSPVLAEAAAEVEPQPMSEGEDGGASLQDTELMHTPEQGLQQEQQQQGTQVDNHASVQGWLPASSSTAEAAAGSAPEPMEMAQLQQEPEQAQTPPAAGLLSQALTQNAREAGVHLQPSRSALISGYPPM